jgi:Mrp family chromosome partitioning ATPase
LWQEVDGVLWNRKGKKKTKQKKGMFHVEQFSQKGNNQGVKTLPSVTRIIAIANQKGGVAKTTTAVNLSACLAAWDRKVLLVDIDPQGNATSGLGVDRDNLTSSIYDLLLGEREIEGVIVDTGIENLDLVPAFYHITYKTTKSKLLFYIHYLIMFPYIKSFFLPFFR